LKPVLYLEKPSQRFLPAFLLGDLEERAALREQKRVEAELAREHEKLDKEKAHYQNAYEALAEWSTHPLIRTD